MGAGEEILTVLKRVEEKLDRVLAGGTMAANNAGEIASDADLDSQYGDEEVKKDPPRWSGDPVAPTRMSLCSAEYLDVLATFHDWKADQDEGKARTLTGEAQEKKLRYAGYERKSARRARGWARRNRANSPTQSQEPDDDFFGRQP